MPYGRQLLTNTSAFPTRVSADGEPEYKAGGITIDTTTIAAASGTATTLPDGSVIAANAQFLRYGQVMTRLNTAEVQTVTFTGGPTSGSAILTLPASGDAAAQTAAAIAFNASAATVEATLSALSRIGAGGVLVARTGAGTAGDPYVYTVTFAGRLGNVPQFTSTNTFAGGTTPTVTHGTTTAGTGTGLFGPYDPAASDGRQTLTRGECFILDETLVILPGGSTFPDFNEIQGRAIEGGSVWIDRIIHSGLGTASLAAGPTRANLLAAFPRLLIYQN